MVDFSLRAVKPFVTKLELPIYTPQSRISIDSDIGRVEFSCDLAVCKGACCTMPGGLGAPILPEELPIIEEVFPIVNKYLPEKALQTIAEKGLWQRNDDGSYTITTIGHDECVFVHWDGDIAKCAIQSAYYAGEVTDFPKPISCHLFPIRIYKEPDGSYYMCYVEEAECEGGRKRGAALSENLAKYLKDPLTRALGGQRYQELLRKLLK